ncbi:MAG: class I SAM-dependent methyltransferase [archaeon]
MPEVKDVNYWDYWYEMVKASVLRDTKELPAIATAARLKGKEVMDVGCGPGRLVEPFSKLAKTITAVDENDWAIKMVTNFAVENRVENVQVVQAPLVSLPFDDDVSESTYCIWVIYHAKSRWQKMVNELVRVTQPGAPIVVGFATGNLDLPALEDLVKPGHKEGCKAFDKAFPAWITEQGWPFERIIVPLEFNFKSPEFALEVFSNTFFPRASSREQLDAALAFLREHTHNKKTVIRQELSLYVITKPKE